MPWRTTDAMLMMPEGAHREGREPRIDAQPLYEDETPVDGSRWYLRNNWEHRDAGFEEIFHLVHDAGIGTYQPGALPVVPTVNSTPKQGRPLLTAAGALPIDPGM